MTLTIDLPEELAFRLTTALPEEERSRFAVAAIEEALEAHLRDEAECIAAVEEGLEDTERGRSLSLEAEQARWQAQKAALLATSGLHTA